jgi:hypothetical protein
MKKKYNPEKRTKRDKFSAPIFRRCITTLNIWQVGNIGAPMHGGCIATPISLVRLGIILGTNICGEVSSLANALLA